ncbi:Protein phosphatase methylesterase 1 [Paramicrosporidium saccamoebae]|uniref:Protein phosphatase methylesterase 1 n=1 Tax=Paramicrosporidium saccamoebae TaxID=1246581 RepID=A0A2H9TNJ6_9FUNG|nr:Protein phosphatase methylesterase 1 [Paramicrosporidium saccamoebae]
MSVNRNMSASRNMKTRQRTNTNRSHYPPQSPRKLANEIVTSRGKWQDYFDEHHIETTERGPDEEQAVLFTHHGAGYSALSFATLTRELCLEYPHIAVVSIDARAHGSSSGDECDLSLDCLLSDYVTVVENVCRSFSAPHYVFLAGHSLGGAVVCRIATQNLLADVAGVIVIDIVEEAALLALRSMPATLARRPVSFSTLEDAIYWALMSGTCRNTESASISIPDQLVRTEGIFQWKVNLLQCRPFWEDWFRGLSQAFVDCAIPRVLVLAEREYLDRTLMIASMQGKFQNSIIRNTGHAIQEDQPNLLAQLIGTFVDRNMAVARLNAQRVALNR